MATQQERADMLAWKRDFSVEPLKDEYNGADDGAVVLDQPVAIEDARIEDAANGIVSRTLYICQECSTTAQSDEPPEGWYLGNGFVLCSWCRGSSESYDKFNPLVVAARAVVANWESGDLAGAVNGLRAALSELE